MIELALCSCTADGQQVETWAELEAFLDDTIQNEDFEGVSLHAGSSQAAPNPLSSLNAPSFWDLQPGVTYSSDGVLSLYARFLNGDDSNMLQAVGGMTIAFDVPHAGIGFELINRSGSGPYDYTVSFYHDAEVVGVGLFTLDPRRHTFAGWKGRGRGITSLVIEFVIGAEVLVAVDNIAWGLDVESCPADLAEPFGVLDFFDVSAFLAAFSAGCP